jgi:N-acetylglutamate synthase-like GNAT family acetyltransferase
MTVKIRKATENDVHAIIQLIRELAEYEKAPQEVVTDENILIRDGFGAHPLFHCFVAETGSHGIIGMALYYIKYSTWKGPCVFLEDIVVSNAVRRSGAGTLLFNAVLNAAKERNALRMEWQVLDWNKPAIEFYKKYNPEVLNEWLNYRLSGEQISQFQINQ